MTDTRSPDELAEHLARALNRGLGSSWYYSNHGYYPNGYDDYPRGIQNMLYEGVEAVLAAINDERPDPRYCSWCGQRLAMPEPAPDALPCGYNPPPANLAPPREPPPPRPPHNLMPCGHQEPEEEIG